MLGFLLVQHMSARGQYLWRVKECQREAPQVRRKMTLTTRLVGCLIFVEFSYKISKESAFVGFPWGVFCQIYSTFLPEASSFHPNKVIFHKSQRYMTTIFQQVGRTYVQSRGCSYWFFWGFWVCFEFFWLLVYLWRVAFYQLIDFLFLMLVLIIHQGELKSSRKLKEDITRDPKHCSLLGTLLLFVWVSSIFVYFI